MLYLPCSGLLIACARWKTLPQCLDMKPTMTEALPLLEYCTTCGSYTLFWLNNAFVMHSGNIARSQWPAAMA
jgi:hypothetical protein